VQQIVVLPIRARALLQGCGPVQHRGRLKQSSHFSEPAYAPQPLSRPYLKFWW
jgi:hypothetical protein